MGTGSSRQSQAKGGHRSKYGILAGHTGGINCIDISESGHILLTGSDDRTARVWDLSNYELKVVLEGHTGYVSCCKVTQERYALTGSMDKTIRKWNMFSGNCILKMDEHKGKVNRLLLRGCLLFSASYDRTVICWDVRDGQPARIFRGHKQGILPVIYAQTTEHDPRGEEEVGRNKDILITGSMDCTARLWSINAGSTLTTFRGHEGAILCLAVDNDKRLLFTGSSDYSVKMWNLDGGAEIKRFCGHEGSIIAIELSNKFMYSASIDGTVRCWVTEFADSTRKYNAHEHTISDMKYHDGLITTSSGDSTLKIFDAKAGSLRRTLKGHKYAVTCFVTAGDFIISGSYDGTVRVWNIRDLVKEMMIKASEDGSDTSSHASSVMFTPSPPPSPKSVEERYNIYSENRSMRASSPLHFTTKKKRSGLNKISPSS